MDINRIITDKIIAILERGATHQGKRWTGATNHGIPTNAKTGEQYRGINILVLWADMADRGYATSQWLTYKQAAELGGQVRKGEKSVLCCYYKTVAKKGDPDGTEGETFFMAKPFWLFNIAQIDNLPADVITTMPVTSTPFTPVQEAEQILVNSQAQINYGFDSAYYSRTQDKICLPVPERFTTAANFYATALHELTHWTGNETRLNRSFGKRFGDDAYAFEELVAELGAAFTMGNLGLADATVESHADYVQSWITVLKNDKKAIFTAASQAAKAADFILDKVTTRSNY